MTAETSEQRPDVVAVAVDPLVDGARRLLEAHSPHERQDERELPTDGAREEDDSRGDRADDEDRLRPDVGADRVAADREQEPDPASRSVTAPPSARSSSTEPVIGVIWPGWRRDVSKIREASPPTEVGRIWPTAYETKYARVSQATALVDAADVAAAAATATPSAAR